MTARERRFETALQLISDGRTRVDGFAPAPWILHLVDAALMVRMSDASEQPERVDAKARHVVPDATGDSTDIDNYDEVQ